MQSEREKEREVDAKQGKEAVDRSSLEGADIILLHTRCVCVCVCVRERERERERKDREREIWPSSHREGSTRNRKLAGSGHTRPGLLPKPAKVV